MPYPAEAPSSPGGASPMPGRLAASDAGALLELGGWTQAVTHAANVSLLYIAIPLRARSNNRRRSNGNIADADDFGDLDVREFGHHPSTRSGTLVAGQRTAYVR